jgi:hypothetical protein
MVDGWGFSLGLGNRITRDYAVAERPISSKCYATSLRLVRGLVGVRCSARVCSNGHVTAGIVQRCESASLAIVLTAANMRAWPLPSRPFTRVAEQRRGALSRSLHAPRSPQASGPPGECRARPAPPAATLAPTRRRRGTAATCTHVDVPCRAGLAVCAAGFTCRRAARPALAALARWWCGINCLDVQLSRAARPRRTTRETDRVGPPKLCPQSISLRSMIGHRCATVAFVALALARMPFQAHTGPSMSASASSRARSGSALAD